MSRIQECHWNGQNIVVLAEVEIQPPYKAESCTGQGGAQDRTLEYIRTIVSDFHIFSLVIIFNIIFMLHVLYGMTTRTL